MAPGSENTGNLQRGLDVNIGIGSLEDEMLNFLKTTDTSPRTARSEEVDGLKRDLTKYQVQNGELQEQLKKIKDLSRRALEDFEHYKQSMELEKVRYKEALFTIENLKRAQVNPEEFNSLQNGKAHLEKQLFELREDLMYTKQSKIQIEKQLEESRLTTQALEQQLSGFKSTAETENKTKQQISSFNSEIGKELKQLTQSKKDLETSLQSQLEKYARLQLQLTTIDTELVRVGKELEKEKADRKVDAEKIKALETQLAIAKKQTDGALKDKDDKHSELSSMKLKYELLIGDLHVKVSEIDKLKSDVKYEENLRVQAEKQMKTFQDLLKRRGENSTVASDVEIAKITLFSTIFEEQKAVLSAEIKALINEKSAVMSEIHDKVKEYEVVKFKQDDSKAPNRRMSILDSSLRSLSTNSESIPEIKSEPQELKIGKESSDNISVSSQNLSNEEKVKKIEKENWRDKASNIIKKTRNEEELQNENSLDIGRNKTIRMLGESARAKQLKNMTISKLKKQKEVLLFGGVLQERADFEGKHVPKIVVSCIKVVELKGLRTEGIYRRAGAMKEMKSMQDECEMGNPIDMANEFIDVLSVSSLLKAYFRDLKVPLIPYDVYEPCVFVVKEPKLTSEIIDRFKTSLRKLLPAHYNTLYYLIQHLQKYLITHLELPLLKIKIR